MSIALSSSLPADDRNGLGVIASAMLDDPERVYVFTGIIACKSIITRVESGDVVPTACIRAVEVFHGETADATELRRLWRRSYERRTGKVELPIELERDPGDITPSEDDEVD